MQGSCRVLIMREGMKLQRVTVDLSGPRNVLLSYVHI